MGNTPIYVNVHMTSGEIANYWIDALQAAWSGVQVGTGSQQSNMNYMYTKTVKEFSSL